MLARGVTDVARGQRRRGRGAVHVRRDRRRSLQPDLSRRRRRRRRATCCADRRSATCWPAPTTWAASTGSSPRCRAPAVPVAPALGLCTDDAVNGAPFYVMGFVDGHVIRDPTPVAEAALTPSARRQAGESLVDTMAAIHAVDLDAVGLDRPRQARGLHRPPAEALVRAVERAEDPRAARRSTRSTTRSSERIPEQGPATIVHGDYRLDNCIVGDDGSVMRRARLGDLHARRSAGRSSGCCRSTGPGPATTPSAWGGSVDHRRGFLDRAELDARYADGQRPGPVPARLLRRRSRTGSWPASCEGVYARYLGGALGVARPGRARAVQASRSTAPPQHGRRVRWRRCR